MQLPTNATVTDRKGLTVRAQCTFMPLKLHSVSTQSRGQISLADEAGELDLNGNFLLQLDDGETLVIWIEGVIAFTPGKNQVFKFQRVRVPKLGDRWPEAGD